MGWVLWWIKIRGTMVAEWWWSKNYEDVWHGVRGWWRSKQNHDADMRVVGGVRGLKVTTEAADGVWVVVDRKRISLPSHGVGRHEVMMMNSAPLKMVKRESREEELHELLQSSSSPTKKTVETVNE
jgi:hypothetical protein